MEFWDKMGHLTPAAKKVQEKLDPVFKRLFKLARTPKEALELELVIGHAVDWNACRWRMTLQARQKPIKN